MCAKKLLTFAALLLAYASATVAFDLAKLCNGELKSIDKISQAKALIAESKSSTGCNEAKLPLAQLEPILNAVEAGQVCQLDFVEMVRQYKADFVHSKEPAPAALRLFFNALCFQVSAECKKSLLSHLEADTMDKVTSEDFELFESSESSKTSKSSGPKDIDEIIMPSETKSLIGRHYKGKRLQMLVHPIASEKMRKMIEVCAAKFRPFYSKLVLPLIELSNLDYNYQGERLEGELNELRTNTLVHKWFNAVQICESFQTCDIFEDKANLIDQKSIALLSEKEADKLRKKQATLNDLFGSVESLKYEPQQANQIDELWIQDEAQLKEQVAIHKVNRKKSKRAKTSYRKNLKKTIKNAISKGMRFKFLSAPKVFSLNRNKNSDTLVELEDVSEMVLREEGDHYLEKRSLTIAAIIVILVFAGLVIYAICNFPQWHNG